MFWRVVPKSRNRPVKPFAMILAGSLLWCSSSAYASPEELDRQVGDSGSEQTSHVPAKSASTHNAVDGDVPLAWALALKNELTDARVSWKYPERNDNILYMVKVIKYLDDGIKSLMNYNNILSESRLREYSLYKEIYAEHYRTGSHPFIGRMEKKNSVFRTGICKDFITDIEDHLSFELAFLAADYVDLESELEDSGYKESVFKNAVAQYEQRSLQLIVERGVIEFVFPANSNSFGVNDVLREALALELESRRISIQPGAARFIVMEDCGAGETVTEIQMLPANGAASRITAFSFDVCVKMALDPWDLNRCRGWLPLKHGDEQALVGHYKVQARWPDGRQLRSDILVEAYSDRPVVIRAP